MLPPENRLTDSQGFRTATRGGRRSGGRGLVVHLNHTDDSAPARVGLVVGRAVGGSVVRNLVKRRLRHLLRERVAALPSGAVVAVRALPASAHMRAAELGVELDRCLSRVGVTVSSPPTPSLETTVTTVTR